MVTVRSTEPGPGCWPPPDRDRDRETDAQTDRHTDRQTDSQAGSQADRQAGKQAGRQTDRQTDQHNRDSTIFSQAISILYIWFCLCQESEPNKKQTTRASFLLLVSLSLYTTKTAGSKQRRAAHMESCGHAIKGVCPEAMCSKQVVSILGTVLSHYTPTEYPYVDYNSIVQASPNSNTHSLPPCLNQCTVRGSERNFLSFLHVP